jgi:Protein of unknown function (DUF2975)
MSDAVHDASFAAAPGPRGPSDLRSRIGWICHALRITAVLWIGWGIAIFLIAWSDKSKITEGWGQLFSVDLSGISNARYAAAFAVAVVDLLVATVVAACLWRLSSTYLAGRVFTVEAALWLRRTGIAGFAAILVDVLARIAVASILTAQFAPTSTRGFFYVMPQDLLHLFFALFVFALAYIFKAAAELADDHAQIV